ncbi:uncharacterized protein LOC129145839 [Talpa occidentalis]|uniref:uncharacterized protein LOC129145839 n=1 Tax=Talpa occidentalis TaxID=50954 RepID=UPI0023F6B460|nr:uncharacterized protein LOC129145839 [Talpa occidentalis]
MWTLPPGVRAKEPPACFPSLTVCLLGGSNLHRRHAPMPARSTRRPGAFWGTPSSGPPARKRRPPSRNLLEAPAGDWVTADFLTRENKPWSPTEVKLWLPARRRERSGGAGWGDGRERRDRKQLKQVAWKWLCAAEAEAGGPRRVLQGQSRSGPHLAVHSGPRGGESGRLGRAPIREQAGVQLSQHCLGRSGEGTAGLLPPLSSITPLLPACQPARALHHSWPKIPKW